ncbi:hypothetical protein KP509_26G015100 [Ceratopteris richardii]|uniref:Homeobox domain-containing protein n=1 Tax=Ceratopteris richardii TaxID=49495 RepID=A0A8T2RJX2_CERRI|nr:hypothetical protein KP509_26G015100 [Ceratopteris richardii]
MSFKLPKPNYSGNRFEPGSLMYPLYTTPHDDLDVAAAVAAATVEPSAGAVSNEQPLYGSRSNVEDVQTGSRISFAERFRRWSFEQEKVSPNSVSDVHGFNMSPFLPVNHNQHHLLSHPSTAATTGRSSSASIQRVAGHGSHSSVLGAPLSSVNEGMDTGFMSVSSSNTQYHEVTGAGFASTNLPQYGTTHGDMEILRTNHLQNIGSSSLQLSEEIPSSLSHPNVRFTAASGYSIQYPNTLNRAVPSNGYGVNIHRDRDHVIADTQHRTQRWEHSLRTSSSGTHPQAELLLLPGVAESVVEVPSTAHTTSLSRSSKLELLHLSSLHDNKGQLPPLGVTVAGGGMLGHQSCTNQMWSMDKLDMAVGLGLNENPIRSTLHLPDIDPYGTGGSTQTGLSLFLQSPNQRAQLALSFDAARYNTRSASGSLGILRNSKYLKPAQLLLNEFCNVCKNGSVDGDDSITDTTRRTPQGDAWNATGCTGTAELNLTRSEDDHGQLSRGFLCNSISGSFMAPKKSLTKPRNAGATTADIENEKSQTRSPDENRMAPPKQLPADERCHLQLRKARLIAMVEELDRRYQQYRDQMQLIVTSFESATGIGGAAPYTTLAKRAMSRQFRSLRDAIGEHIKAVCRTLGEEVSSVPILCRGETPRLRLIDQRLRHQRSLQQISMLPQQQAWRPQRGLPERSVSVLRAWLFEHFLHPYPKDSEKAMLARLTGLSRNQVSNWFINARVRLWKPMVEEMYLEESKALEMMQGEGDSGTTDRSAAASSYGVDQNIPSRYLNNRSDGHPNVPPSVGDLNSFIHFHSTARGHDTTSTSTSQHHGELASHNISWMKSQIITPALPANSIGVLSQTHVPDSHHDEHHRDFQNATALMQGHAATGSSTSFTKHGVSLTLGLQQPPPHSTYNSSATHGYHVRPSSEALLF